MGKAENKGQIEIFGEVMDEVIKRYNVAMLIDMPEGTMAPKLTDNVHLGPVIQFYILLHALAAVFKQMCEFVDVDPEKKEDLVDGLLAMVKDEVLRGEEEDDE